MIDFENLVVITSTDIKSIDKKGIKHCGTSKYIDFQECCKNYSTCNQSDKNNIVGTKDVSDSNPSIDFYTNPITEMFFMNDKNEIYKFETKLKKLGYILDDL